MINRILISCATVKLYTDVFIYMECFLTKNSTCLVNQNRPRNLIPIQDRQTLNQRNMTITTPAKKLNFP